MTSNPDVVRLHEPADVIETIPYLVGFYPHDSVVLVALNGRRVVVTVRFDLDAGAGSAALGDALAVLVRSKVTGVAVAIYDEAPVDLSPAGPLPHDELVDAITDRLDELRIPVLDAYLVADGRWWSFVNYTPGCSCCTWGEPLAGERSAAAATATFAGMVARSARSDLDALLEPAPIAERELLRPHIERAEQQRRQAELSGTVERWRRSVKRAAFAAAREADGALWPAPTLASGREARARLAVALADVTVRDSVWLAVDQRRLDGRALWQYLAVNLPDSHNAPALFLFGWCSWRDGSGALASVAAERALTSDSTYGAAELLLGAVRHGLDPFRTPRLRGSRRTE